MKLNKQISTTDPVVYKRGWEKAQKEFEAYLKFEYQAKAKLALRKLKKGESIGQVIEAA